MIDHVSIGIRDIENARKFYDAALKPLGYTCLSSSDAMLGYGTDAVAFWLLASPSPVPANADSGLHFCFAAPTRKSVDAFFIRPRSRRVAAIMESPTFARTSALATTLLSLSIPTATGSRPIAASLLEGASRYSANNGKGVRHGVVA
jgi:hypothetical protein